MPAYLSGLISLVSLIFISVSTAIRILLFALTPKSAALTYALILKIVAAGFIFDFATLSYALLPVALYLAIVPKTFAVSKWHNWLVRLLFALFAAALLFDGCAEYFFFDEFGTRFNFIAVDYLIYTREVIGNIRESYPLGFIFPGIAATALVFVWLLRNRIDRAAGITFGGRHRRAGVLLLIPFLAVLAFVNVSQTAISPNNFANELAGNGIYNLVAAFRNNELSFSQFYMTAPEDKVLDRLHALITERNNRYIAPDSRGFTRHITAEGPEKLLNLIVVVEESLSAEYLGSFGNRENLTPNLDRLAAKSLLFTNLYA
ncbi:MAG: hypothetical protein WA003_03915, partial [Desulfuromonadaceae bacterium]